MEETNPPHNRGKVPPSAVRPPQGALGTGELRPEHLYKAVGLLFVFALFFHYLTDIVATLLLAYAAVVVAVLFNALVGYFPSKRKWVTAALGLLILASAVAVIWLGIPILMAQVRDLTGRVPEFEQTLRAAEQWIKANTGLNIPLVGPKAQEFLQNNFLSSGEGDLLSRASGALGVLVVPLLILFGALYAVGNPNERLLNPLLRAVPRDRRLAFRRMFQLLGERLMGWAKGVLIAMVAVGILSFVLFLLIGVPNALLLGLIAGLMEAIPLLGPWVGGSIAVIVAFLDDPTKALWVALAALAVQQFESNLLTPWAMSRAAEVHPFVTLFSLVLFGYMFGFLGILLAIPIVLFLQTVIEVLWVERAIDTDQDRIDPIVEE